MITGKQTAESTVVKLRNNEADLIHNTKIDHYVLEWNMYELNKISIFPLSHY